MCIQLDLFQSVILYGLQYWVAEKHKGLYTSVQVSVLARIVNLKLIIIYANMIKYM